MACVTLDVEATEGSTYVVTVEFYDEDSQPVTPNSAAWTLTDEDGEIVNGREDVVLTPAQSVEVVLQGLDLAPGSSYAELTFTVEGTYNSDLGSNLPYVDQCKIPVAGLLP